MATRPNHRSTLRLAIKLRHSRHALGNLGSSARTHHLRPSPSRTLLGNEQTAGYLGMPGKDAKSPRILTLLTSGGHIDRRTLIVRRKPTLLPARSRKGTISSVGYEAACGGHWYPGKKRKTGLSITPNVDRTRFNRVAAIHAITSYDSSPWRDFE